ncbi:MAG: hypothetical protein RL392_2246, partial [Pseudomonadota bacterium]
MPVHHTIDFGEDNLDQATLARPGAAMACLRAVHGPMGGTNDPVPR